jgi:hypothetical protein
MAGMLLIRFLKSGLEAVTGTSYCMKHGCINTSYHLLMNQSTTNFTLLLLLLCLLIKFAYDSYINSTWIHSSWFCNLWCCLALFMLRAQLAILFVGCWFRCSFCLFIDAGCPNRAFLVSSMVLICVFVTFFPASHLYLLIFNNTNCIAFH